MRERDTGGGRGRVTLMTTGAEVRRMPALSVAMTERGCEPRAGLFSAEVYGGVVSRPRLVAPSKNSTLVMVLMVLRALALSERLVGEVNTLLPAGLDR